MTGHHLSRLTLARILAGERTALHRAEAHLTECRLCSQALSILRTRRAEWLSTTDGPEFLRTVVRRCESAVR